VIEGPWPVSPEGEKEENRGFQGTLFASLNLFEKGV